MGNKRGSEVATIDVAMVTIQEGTEPATDTFCLNTSSKIAVEVQTDVAEAVKLVVKGALIAQKPPVATITGHKITLSDNVFNAEVTKILQGGTIVYDTVDTSKVMSYTPPTAGSGEKGKMFKLKAYSSIYDASGAITGYECIEYPNCFGQPVSLSSEDGAFRAPEYVIYSAPKASEAPYKLTYEAALPVVG